ncbi:BREX-2 system adenine-specific DNA-methyltransferase PglX [Micromonospora sp. WMMD1274]|uniref:BREX-2 system adenine-specific DNA-methyltransferase PglX n=1 Tax=Micromonospora sp. WMMD1274 TaxID=3404116 RepID=UPI003B934F63
MAVSTGLTAALKKVVLDLEDDLRDRVASQPDVLATWKQEHKAAESRERTAMSWQEWRDDRVTQAAVAWVLTTVFVRFCEDNRLLKPVWIAGPADRRQEALDAELAYFRAHPEDTDREWVLQAVEYLRSTKATRDLVESHSPLWTVSPSGQAARRLIAFWRERTADGDLVWDLADPDLSTRFLGDLYQDLSDYAKSTYALLQTPEFVEEFILDQTMEPALADRPLEGFKIIDPTCGSGHFLLGAFTRLNDRWAAHAPGLEVQARVQNALDAIHGVDLNPSAVAIARFRLVVVALQAVGLTSLENAPAFQFHLAVGDSLLHGRLQLALDLPGIEDYDSGLSGFAYTTENLAALRSILDLGKYDVVVGNPPYITVKDQKLNAAYREIYPTCSRNYALTVPFMERFFQLANPGMAARPAGWIGQITSNSFMKREFGQRLVEQFLSRKNLRAVIDSEGAWIPGHNTDGTPTVIIIARPGRPSTTSLRVVQSKGRRENKSYSNGSGPYWTAIAANIENPGYSDEYVAVVDLPRSTFARHPWNLSGGDKAGLLGKLNDVRNRPLSDFIADVGRTTKVGGDDAWYFGRVRDANRYTPRVDARRVLLGEAVRDFSARATTVALWPYVDSYATKFVSPDSPIVARLWPYRTTLRRRLIFGETLEEKGRPWFDHLETYPSRMRGLSIAFAFVATHNHFALDRGNQLAANTAPIVKLPDGATEDDYLAILGVLSSSTACFWLKENSQPKGGAADVSFLRTYEFTGTTLKDYPMPADRPVDLARSLDDAARLSGILYDLLDNIDKVPSAESLEKARSDFEAAKARSVAAQEELDWLVYHSYGITESRLTCEDGRSPELRLGERAFEIALARRLVADGESTQWFERHGSAPVTEIPKCWPQAYRDMVQRRLDLIESNRFINLLERPEYKRRWATEPWEKQVEKALRAWLLDRLEAPLYWFDAQGRPTARSVAQLADVVSRDPDLVSVLQLWDGRKDRSVTQQLSTLLDSESVPFLAAYRLKDAGLRKREAWEHTWDLQRREDEGEKVGEIPVPPKYTSADFRKQSWWQHRGKLDVPKERFIVYPDAGRETDSTQLLGWAGWDHAQQALALNAVIAEREAEGWADDKLVPLVAGLAELQPWVRQWHDKTDPTYQLNLADYLEEQLRGRAHQVGMTVEQLGAWRPPAASRGRRPRS